MEAVTAVGSVLYLPIRKYHFVSLYLPITKNVKNSLGKKHLYSMCFSPPYLDNEYDPVLYKWHYIVVADKKPSCSL